MKHFKRYITVLAAVCLSVTAHAQDIPYKLAGPTQKKWVGSTIFITSSEENFTDITFFKNHSLIEENRKYKTKKKPVQWKLINGDYINDPKTTLLLNGKYYQAEFSFTDNGKEFLTLTSLPEREEEDVVVKTFYAE